MNKKQSHRRYVKLTENARNALQKKKPSQSFWTRFKAPHPTLIQKRQELVSMKRALNCTREMAESHLDELADELIQAGIMTDARKNEDGE